MSANSTSSDLASTWTELHTGIEHIMNNLEQGLSYQRYMALYTYVDAPGQIFDSRFSIAIENFSRF